MLFCFLHALGWHNPRFALNEIDWQLCDACKLTRRFNFGSSSAKRFAKLPRNHCARQIFRPGRQVGNPPFAASSIAGPEFANTNFTPITLSWTLGHGWFTALGLTFVAPIGS